MNIKNLNIVGEFTIVLILFFSVQGSHAVIVATVWSDNFDDGNYDDWTVLAGTLSASEHALRVTGFGYVVVYRNSTTVTGTWNFDLDMTDEPDDAQVCFITNSIDGKYVRDNYLVENTEDGFRLMRWIWDGSKMNFLILDNYIVTGGLDGWYHFDITRDGSGQMYVYINDTLAMQAVDTTHDISSCFVFNVPIAPSGTGPAIDNVVVSDSVDITPPTTETTSSQEDEEPPPSPSTTDYFGDHYLLFFTIGIMSLVIIKKRRKDQT